MAGMSGQLQSDSTRRGVFPAVVRSNRLLCDEHFLLRLDVGPTFPPSRAGQFVQLACGRRDAEDGPVVHEWPEERPPRFTRPELAENQVLLRRPFSLAGREKIDGRVVLDVIARVIGRGTAWLSRLNEGENLSVLGPLGNAFTWKDSTKLGVLVGGGVGMPPMLYLAEGLHRDGKAAMAFMGATSRNLLPFSVDSSVTPSKAGWPSLCVREFTQWATEVTISTDDGSLGFEGRVTDALWNWVDQGRLTSGETIVYTCGPERMMRAVAEGCVQRGIACQVAMERKMVCGMGTCQSCVCRMRSDSPPGWQYSLVCTDGPIFDARDLVWDK
jgi:dihydroorotate dehydrogenase electron transfer subunit